MMQNASLLRLLAAALLSAAFLVPSDIWARSPLILEETQTIFERVLTRPGAPLSTTPNGPVVETYAPFQPLYVFGRSDGWVEVGPSFSAEPVGWVPEDSTVLWKQNIVGAFTKPVNRNRQLFFDSQGNLEWLINHEVAAQVQAELLADAENGTLDGERGVISVEPADFVNIRDQLYVMPILEYVESLDPVTYNPLRLMEVASLPKEEPNPEPVEPDGSNPFDVGIVFLLDTTQSMEPYIALTQRVLAGVVEQLAGTDVGELVNFAVIGFRDNNTAVPGLEYRTRTLVPMLRRQNEAPVIDAIEKAINVADANSPGFNEDSLAAVEDAIDQIDWEQTGGGDDAHRIDARYVILVTDAGPKDPRDPNARSQIGAGELQIDAEGKGIVIMTLHLKTPPGVANHAYAEGAYRKLSRFADNNYYYGIEDGSEAAFEAEARRLVTALTDHVRIVRGEETVLEDTDIDLELRALGRAMQLAWLGTVNDTQAPDIIRGWVSDMAVDNFGRLAVEPRLLITKNELATLATLLENLIRFGEQAQDTGEAMMFFDQVQGLIADMAQNPDMVINGDADTLGGAIEFIDRLPYQSQILAMTPERWGESTMFRRTIIDGMSQKLVQYRKWLFDSGVWTELYEGSPDGEYVFAMPFDVLP